VRRSCPVGPFCAAAIALLGCHRAPAVALDAAPEGTTPPTANIEVNLGALDGGLPSNRVPDLKLAGGGDPSSPPTNVVVELAVEGPTEPNDARTLAGLRLAFATCAARAVKADASIAASPTLVVAIAFNGDVTSATLDDPRGVSPGEAECLTHKMQRASFDAAPPRTLRITIKQSPAK
jgi:hypothetical protein